MGLLLALVGLDLSEGPPPHGVHRAQVRADRLHLESRDEVHEIEPVRTDVGARPERAPFLGDHAQVVVGIEQQPVLRVAAPDVKHVAQITAPTELACLQAERVVAHVVVDGRGLPGSLPRQLDELRRLRGVHRQRLLAQDVLPRGERGLRHLEMELIRHREVHRVHGGVGQQLVERAVELIERERVRCSTRLLIGQPQDPDHGDTDAPQGLDVHRPHEPRADHGDTDFLHGRTLAGFPFSAVLS